MGTPRAAYTPTMKAFACMTQVAVMREIIGGLMEAGFIDYAQIDAPGFTSYVDDASIGRLRARQRDPSATLALSIAAENAVVRGFDSMTFGIHLCRGNEHAAIGTAKDRTTRSS